MRIILTAALAAMLAACASGPQAVELTGPAKVGEALFKPSSDTLKRAVNCTGFYRNVGRFANNPMENVPGNLAWWQARLQQFEPSADKQALLSAYVDVMIPKTFGPRPDRGGLDSLQQGANYEYQIRQCLRERREIEGGSAS